MTIKSRGLARLGVAIPSPDNPVVMEMERVGG